ncbi:MAG: hypothetical protein ACTSRG_17435 [Candidatus Helarchaeota archaeon]
MKDFQFSIEEYDDLIKIKKKISDKIEPEIKHEKKITHFIPGFKEKEQKKSKEELKLEKIKYEKENFFMGYFIFLSSNNILLVSTNRIKIIAREFFNYFLNKAEGISKLWLSFQLMDDFLIYLRKEKYSKIIEEISTFYSKNFRKRSNFRPDIERRLLIKSLDSEDIYLELKDDYGIYPRRYIINFIEYGTISLNKEHSIFQFSNFNPDLLLKDFIPWIYNRAYVYISKILDFKLFEIVDPITEVKNNLSNYLIFNYKSKIELNLNEIITEIKNNPSYEIITYFGNSGKNIDIKANEKISGSIINMYLSNFKVYFTLEEGIAYDAVYPILDIIDQYGDLEFSIDY